jgi:autotransporter-associated beta strand protein
MKTTIQEIIGLKKSKLNLFKTLAASCGLLLLLQSAQAQFSFPVYEPFAYGEKEELGAAGSSATNWASGNSVSSSCATIYAASALSYPGLVADTNATPRGLRSNSGTGKSRYASFTSQNSTIYASFLLNVSNTTGTADRLFFALSASGTGLTTPSGVWLSSANQLKISKNSSAAAATNVTSALMTNNTYLVVMRYRVTGSNDEVALWLDPPYFGNNANIPSPTITTTNNANASTFAGLAFYGAANVPLFSMDEIRVDNNWAGVTTNSALPGPAFAVIGGGSGCPGDSFAVGLSGSVTTNIYLLYTNSVYSGTSVTGTGSAMPSAFGAQSTAATYSVLASNTTTAAVGWLTNTVAITVLAPPNITTQPVPAVAATNNVAVFTVVASGNGLNYQWYRNGSVLSDAGHIAGSATSTLVISPATTADTFSGSQGYYCVITNSCGALVTSTTNSLTLDAPANIVWQGGNPNTNWDLATTANYTNSAGTPVVFNGGDNVTFDDSSTKPAVTILGSYIAPTLITEKASQNYSFAGNAITGSGALLMTGSGALTVSNANNFTGGTTISNGAVKAQNYGGLGSGAVTLAGGILEFPASGSASTGLTNNINVIANSILQYDYLGTYGCVFFGGISGSPGTTLNINLNNANAGTSRFRLYGGFTNNANISLSTAGATNEIAPYQGASQNQVYNGVISGNGHFIVRSASMVFFNNTNTLSDGTYSVILSGGSIGLGVDTTYATPPAIQSSPVGTNDLAIDATAGNCTIIAEGGARTLGNGIYYLPVSTNDQGALFLSGSNSLTLSGNLQLTEASDSYGTHRAVNVNNTATTIISGVISDGGKGSSLTKSGAGTLYLNGNNTYTGPTTNGAGLMVVNGSLAAGSSLLVNTSATLGGTGIINGATTIVGNGILNPGLANAGILTINNNLTLNAASTNLFLVTATGVSNMVSVTAGTLTPNGSVVEVNTAGTQLASGTNKLFTYAAITGAFNATPVFVTPQTGIATNAYIWNDNGGNIYLVVTNAATEPVFSTDASLSYLALSPPGTLSPSFSSGTTNYTATNANAATTVTVTVTNTSAYATNLLFLDGVAQGSPTAGSLAASVPLGVGSTNVIKVQVTAQDGLTVSNYFVTVTRLSSTNALLSNLVIAPARALSPAFAAGTTSYNATNIYPTNGVTVTATSADGTAALALSFNTGSSYNIPLTNGVASGTNTMSLSQPANVVAVRVVSQDLSQTNIYTVNVLLQPSQTMPNLSNSVSGNTLTLTWPADHLGYRLLVQTNNLANGVSGNISDWMTVPGSTAITSTNITIITSGVTNEYYQLVYP